MSLDLILPSGMTNTGGLPAAYPDEMMAAGTLMIWEPGHPANPFVGVPTAPAPLSGNAGVSTPMPNIAAATAAALCGGVSLSSVLPSFSRNDGGQSAAPNVDMLIDRSAKGGLNVITSQATMAAFRFAGLRLPQAIKDYIFANQAHNFMWTAWYEVTRVDANNTGPYAAIMKGAGSNAGIINIGRGGPQGLPGVNNNVVAAGARNTLGLVHEQVANNYDGTAPTNATTDLLDFLFGFSYLVGAYGDHGRNKSISANVYRLTLEDLTASARVFAEAAAVDVAMRQAAFGVGGRYNGDSHTAVSALP